MNILSLLQGLQNGTLDAKSEVLRALKGMTPQQRQQAKSILPQVEAMAKQAGISTEELNELGAHLK